jgi:hypothetical protein
MPRKPKPAPREKPSGVHKTPRASIKLPLPWGELLTRLARAEGKPAVHLVCGWIADHAKTVRGRSLLVPKTVVIPPLPGEKPSAGK